METQQETTDIKAKITELRQKYARLRNLCGPNGISRETIEAYKKEIQTLESQLISCLTTERRCNENGSSNTRS